MGLGIGLAIAATALLPLSHAFTGRLPSLHASRLARRDPRRLGAAGPGGHIGTDTAGAAHAACRDGPDRGLGLVRPAQAV